MNYSHPELRQKLAGEYVLGTLHGGARRRFERLLAEDRALQQLVQGWERRLSPWLQAVPAEAPPPRVWQGIQQRLGQGAARAERRTSPVWQWLGLGSTAVAATLAAVLVLRPAPAPQVMVVKVPMPAPAPVPMTDVAVLSTDKAEPMWIVRRKGEAMLELAGLQDMEMPTDNSLELWAIPEGGAPQSLGVIQRRDARTAELALTAASMQMLASGKVLAISLEPVGGSPTGAPTGPVLYTGKMQG
jgi:anti-sigma-K factor RskA